MGRVIRFQYARRVFIQLFVLVLLSSFSAMANSQSPSVLVLNSYHNGYTWSDEVTNGIENAIYHSFPDADISIEYMDTKRNDSESYFEKVSALYHDKYSKVDYDLIFATDDNAIKFVMNNKSLFGEAPIVYCGANNVSDYIGRAHHNVVGLKEYIDIKGTIETALRLQPEITNVVVVNDKTTTGRQIAKEFNRIKPLLPKQLSYSMLDDVPLTDLSRQLAELTPNTIVLLLAYFRDQHGSYYSPAQTASELSQASSVPVYSVWDFYFNYGVVGGVMLSGYRHGEISGDMGVSILEGKTPSEVMVKPSASSQLLIDYRQLMRHGLKMSNLPHNALVKNIQYSNERSVLVLLSYSAQNQWSQSVLAGVTDTLSGSEHRLRTFTEFMDTKRYNDKAYINELLSLYRRKYQNQNLDAIIVSDDNALSFARRYRRVLFPDTPIIFAGINYLKDPEDIVQEHITGVTESYDITETIRLGLKLFPTTRKLFVINDETTTGKANMLRLEQLKPTLPSNLEVIESGLVSMQELTETIANLDDDTLILLMSFTTDKNNQRFSYKSSLDMIHQHANRPILGFWDFYLGGGITAGVVTSGYEQGEVAGSLALKVLDGTPANEIPVVLESPVKPIVDFQEMARFLKNDWEAPGGVTVINQPETFYQQNKAWIWLTVVVLLILLKLIFFQRFKIIRHERAQKHLAEKVVTDDLTGVKTRNYLLSYLEKELAQPRAVKNKFALCYFDLDSLKSVNDNFGHLMGDSYIINAVQAIRNNIRAEDVLCRIGGDEFVAVLRGCGQAEAADLCQKVNAELKRRVTEEEYAFHMSVSCGISILDAQENMSVATLLEQADQRMYQNKQKKKTCSG